VVADACGSVWAWGANVTGQLGYATGGVVQPTPRKVPGLHLITDVAAGNGFTIAKRQDGSIWAWGANDRGQLGNGTMLSEFDAPTLVGVGGAVAPITIWAGRDSGIVNFIDNTVRAWGGNGSGQLGNGTTANSPDPVTVMVPSAQGPSATWIAAAPWAGHVLATDPASNVVGWGDNAYGAVGVGAPGSLVTSPRALGIHANGGIAAGGQFSVAVNGVSIGIRNVLQVTTWGRNDMGQLAQGPPNPVANLPASAVAFLGHFAIGVTAPAAGQDFVLMNGQDLVTGQPLAVGWGANVFGQLDTGAADNRLGPVRMLDALQFQAGAHHVLGTDSPLATVWTGQLWAWGANDSGQVGTGGAGPGSFVPSSQVVLTGLVGVPCQPSAPAAAVSAGTQTSQRAGLRMHAGRPLRKVAGAGVRWSVRAPRPATRISGTGRVVRPA
jgi:alpha-tubulin suppressor-like RCC1 family protein